MIDFSALTRRLETIRQRVAGIYQDSNNPLFKSKNLAAAVAEFSMFLEELQVTIESLQENEKLLAFYQELELERQRYRELFEYAPDSYLVTTSQGIILEVNQVAATMLNVRSDFLVGKPLILFVDSADRRTLRTLLNQLSQSNSAASSADTEVELKALLSRWLENASSQALTSEELEIIIQPREKEPFPVAIAVSGIYNSLGQLVGLRWLLRDITHRKQAEAQLKHNAFHDSLTSLPNRHLLLNRLKQALKLYQRHRDRLFALLFIDLDGFKSVNDRFGHLTGDRVLVETARRLLYALREGDTVARLGGDEFVILLEGIHSLRDAEDCANRIQQTIIVPLTIDGHTLEIDASIGVVIANPYYQKPEDFLRDADLAMYRAKQQERTGQPILIANYPASALTLEQQLRQAIEQEKLQLFYQGIYALRTHQLLGFEASVQWLDPTRELASLKQLSSSQETENLVASLSWWVLQEACRQLAHWQSNYPNLPSLYIAVNLTRQQLIQDDLAIQIMTLVQEAGLAPNRLKLEIPEQVIMNDNPKITVALETLLAAQVRLYIDNFGTSFFSLSRLNHRSIEVLKLSPSLLASLEESNLDLVRASIALAHHLKKGVIAEGVETAKQVKHIQLLGCDWAQGNYYHPPLSSQDANTLLAEENKRQGGRETGEQGSKGAGEQGSRGVL